MFPATDEGQVYYPMFFTHDKPFEEFYCIAIQLLNKTWKEMKATAEDFTKVCFVAMDVTDGKSFGASFENMKLKKPE